MNAHEPRFVLPPHSCSFLDNGLTVIWIEHHDHPALYLALQIPVGSFQDPFGKEGTAELACALMGKGSRTRSPRQYAEELEQRGALAFAEADDEYQVLGVRGLAKHAEVLIPLFWETITAPGLDKKEFNRLRKELAAGLQAELVEPGSLARRHFHAQLFGRNHPAGRMHTLRTVQRISFAGVCDFIRARIGPCGSCLAVIGDFDAGRARQQWEPLFASWSRATTVDRLAPAPAPRLDKTNIRLVDKPDLTQAFLVLGHGAPGELAEDMTPLALANYILGGGNFSSRLMARLRSSAGQTYGVGSYLALNRTFGIFTIETSTSAGQTAEMLRGILDEYRGLARRGVTADEVDKAKRYAIGNMAFQLEGIGNIADKLLWLRFYGRDAAYLENFAATVEAVSHDRIHDAVQRHLSSSHFVITAVGPRHTLLEQLAQFGSVDVVEFRSDP